jgi:dTDP-4-dehydrorhamnose reductase
MKILVTGSNGLLGQKLSDLILKHPEHQLMATGLGPDRYGGGAYFYTTMDIANRDEVFKVIGNFKPDVIIHTAAMTQVDQCESEREACMRLNVEALENIIEVSNQFNAFLIHLSTDFIFDGENGPYIEEDIPKPISFYGESKLLAEKLIQQKSKQWAIVRTILVYGVVRDMSRSNIVLWVKQNLEQGKNIRVVDDQWRTPTLAEDLALGCLLVAEQKAEGIWNISGPDMLCPFDMALQTADFFGLDKSLIERVNSSIFSQPAKRPPKTGFDISKARKYLGFSPKSFKEGLDTLAKQL